MVMFVFGSERDFRLSHGAASKSAARIMVMGCSYSARRIILELIMRIAIDIRKINEFGVGTYIWNLVRNLSAIDERNDYLLVGSNRNFHELGPLPPNFRQLYQPDEDALW